MRCLQNNKMTNSEKKEIVNAEYNKCKAIIKSSLLSGNYEKALAAISVCSSLLYIWNQKVTDDYLEESISTIAKATTSNQVESFTPISDTVLFYDGIGFDTRGLALIYLQALAKLGKKIVYITTIKAKNNQPEIEKTASKYNIKIFYYSSIQYLNRLRELQQLLSSIRPSSAFLYTMPDDCVGIAAFMQMNAPTKYQINLTDHAFWLGVNSFDYCLEFRNYGACISSFERGIKKEKIIMMPYYPVINVDAQFDGFPFDAKGKKVLFSGGWIYKTIDKDGTFYKMVDKILDANDDTVFLYAGYGSCSYMEDLKDKYENRVYTVSERVDLFQLMQHITLYLNTYPMPGGLMMQYAAVAGKIPITLWHNNENSGILIDQEKRKIEYRTPDALINDVNRLLKDPQYLKKREELLIGSVIDKEEFMNNLDDILKTNKTKYPIEYVPIATNIMKQEYMERFNIGEYYRGLARKPNFSLFHEYKKEFIRKMINKLCHAH